MRHDLIPAVAFLSAYNRNDSPEHPKEATYSLRNVQSTPELGINFSSIEETKPHAQIIHPFTHNVETYFDTSSSTPISQNELTD